MKNTKSNSLYNSVLSSSTSIVISLSLVLFVLGLLALLIINTQNLSNYIKENIGFTIIINSTTNEIDIIKFQKELDATKFTKKTQFISKEKATANLKMDLGEDFVEFLGYSPLLASIDVKLNADYANNDSLILIDSQLRKNNIVHDVFYQKDLVEKINNNVNRISAFLLSFCFLLFIIAFVLINNTIRLSIYAKRFLIRTMRLVGATNNFIQKPFLLKGIYQGLYSAIFAIFMLIGSIQLIQQETKNMLNINDLKIIGIVFVLILIFGLFISWISTFFAVRKYIKLNEHELYN